MPTVDSVAAEDPETAAKTAAPAAAKKSARSTSAEGEAAFSFASPMFSDAARERYDALLKSFNDNAEEFQGRTQEMLDAGRESFETAQTHLQEAGSEMLEAARQDMADAVDFANELARAKTVAEAMEIQRDYWTRLFESRADRVRSMTETSMAAIRETAEPMQRTMKTAFAQPAFAGFEAFFPFAKK